MLDLLTALHALPHYKKGGLGVLQIFKSHFEEGKNYKFLGKIVVFFLFFQNLLFLWSQNEEHNKPNPLMNRICLKRSTTIIHSALQFSSSLWTLYLILFFNFIFHNIFVMYIRCSSFRTSVASKNEGVWVLGFDLQVLAGSDPIYVVLLYDYSFFFLIKHYGNSFYFSRYKICTKFTSLNLEKTLARCFQSEAEGQ
ncbi:hypothetical protein ACJX0J_036086 [Zea mays]